MPAHRLLGALSTLVEQSGEILGQNQGVHSNSSTLTCAAPSYTPVTGEDPLCLGGILFCLGCTASGTGGLWEKCLMRILRCAFSYFFNQQMLS